MEETILQEAQRIVYGDREETYGHPGKNFEQTAAFWEVWMASKYGTSPPFDVEDVAMMMALLKMARQAHQHKRDNLVDLCGYTACIQKVLDHGAETRNDILPERAQPSSDARVPYEALEPVRRGPGRPLVQREGSGSVGGMEIPAAAEAACDVDCLRPFTDATGVDGCKIS